jgi:hypothetical protein
MGEPIGPSNGAVLVGNLEARSDVPTTLFLEKGATLTAYNCALARKLS